MTKTEISTLKEVYDTLTMMRFGAPMNGPVTTEQVVEATRIWRDTWILPPVAKIIHKYDKNWRPANPHHLS
jgi:hypothetical protein